MLTMIVGKEFTYRYGKTERTNNNTFTPNIYYKNKLALNYDNTNTNTNVLFYDDIGTFNLLWFVQLGGWKCIISSTIASKRISFVFTIAAIAVVSA